MFSPYQATPLDLNPLRDIFADMIDFETFRKRKVIKRRRREQCAHLQAQGIPHQRDLRRRVARLGLSADGVQSSGD
jgi:hypothetical protein